MGVAWRAAIVALGLLGGASVLLSRQSSALDQARTRIEQGASPVDPAVQALVGQALSRDAATPAAIELAALGREAAGERPAAARLYALSDAISRRSLATRLWLVQDAVARGDVTATLANMDIALRTSTAAPDIVFPALARGLEDPALVAPIARLVDRPSDWRAAFLAYSTTNARPEAAASLVLALHDTREVARQALDRKLLVRLVDADQVAMARRLETKFAPSSHAPAPALVDGTFADPSARYPFGWGLSDAHALGAARATEAGHSVLAYHAQTAENGQVASQLLTLPAGRYVLRTTAARTDASEVRPLWVLSCTGGSRAIATLAVPAGENAGASARFAVPADCPGQWLVLNLRPALAPQAGTIAQVAITAE